LSDEIQALLRKARESLQAATLLKERGFFDFSASRAYYSMLYAAEAILLTKDLRLSKHQAVIAAFGKHFAKSELVPVELHRFLLDGFRNRLEGDYGPWGEITAEIVDDTLENARKFLDETSQFLSGQGIDV
jgi:uncharacterized protein (UPF0332 family)